MLQSTTVSEGAVQPISDFFTSFAPTMVKSNYLSRGQKFEFARFVSTTATIVVYNVYCWTDTDAPVSCHETTVYCWTDTRTGFIESRGSKVYQKDQSYHWRWVKQMSKERPLKVRQDSARAPNRDDHDVYGQLILDARDYVYV